MKHTNLGTAGIVTKVLIKTTNKHLFHLLILVVVFDFVWHGLGELPADNEQNLY